MSRLADRVVAITGGANGIGRACAIAYARAGARVAITDLDGNEAERVAADPRCRQTGSAAWRLDVTDRAEVERVVAEIEERLGPIDVWHNNAGISTMAPFLDLTDDEWDANMRVNASGVFKCSQVIAARFIARRRGRLLVTASMAGRKGDAPFLAHYVASKFAVVGLTQAMAGELAPFGITVNAICPGFVSTGMQQREIEWEAALRGTSTDAVIEEYVRATPLGRLESPEDVAGLAVFLASDDAAFITGQAIGVNGGAWMG